MRRFHYDIIDSTNTTARQLAADYPGESLLVTSEQQSAGRGRHGRSWTSPRGGAWLSIAWPTKREASEYARVSLLVAVAVRRAVVSVVEATRVAIKWPNDILIDDRKTAGILCEQWSDEKHRLLVIGIGINVDFDLAQLPQDVRHPATTLSLAAGRVIPVDDVIDAVAEEVVAVLQQFEANGTEPEVLAELSENLAYVGTIQEWQLPRETIRGRVLGIDERGRLMLETSQGTKAYEVGEFAPIQA